MSTNTPQPDWADQLASQLNDLRNTHVSFYELDVKASDLIRQAAANHYIPELRMAEEERLELVDALKKAGDALERVSGAIDDRFQDDLNEEVISPVMARIQALTHPKPYPHEQIT